MKKRTFHTLLIVSVLLFVLPHVPFHANDSSCFSFDLDKTQASREGLVRLRVRSAGTSPVPAGFRIRVSFDGNAVQYVGTEEAASVGEGNVETNVGSEGICSVYVCGTQKGRAPPLSGTVLSYVFRVGADAPAGAADFSVTADQVCDYGGDSLSGASQDLTLRIVPQKSTQAYLTDLAPSVGKLRPEFSSDVFEYRLSVSWQTKTVTFEADAGEGGTVKANRKTLGGEGSDTPIALTVTSADKGSKQVYLITVHREEKPASSRPEEPNGALGENAVDTRRKNAASREGDGSSRASAREDALPVQAEETASGGESSAAEDPAGHAREPARLCGSSACSVPAADEYSPSREEAEQSGAEEQGRAELRFVGNTMPAFVSKLAALLCCLAACAAIHRRLPAVKKGP